MISLVPMAGRGSRFLKAGHRLPKPFIPIMGIPMFLAALKSFPQAEKIILICQEWFLTRYHFETQVKKYLPSARIISVAEVSEGQACTCLLAQDFIADHEELLISSIDYQIVYDEAEFARLRADDSVDVVIFTFQTRAITKRDPKAFAYCRVQDGDVVEVVEKRLISEKPDLDPAVVGTFYYKRTGDFIRSAQKIITQNIRVNNEFYVGTSINQLIAEGMSVRAFPVTKFISFGDPFELQLFQYWEDFFYQEKNHPYSGLKNGGFQM